MSIKCQKTTLFHLNLTIIIKVGFHVGNLNVSLILIQFRELHLISNKKQLESVLDNP